MTTFSHKAIAKVTRRVTFSVGGTCFTVCAFYLTNITKEAAKPQQRVGTEMHMSASLLELLEHRTHTLMC